MPHTSKRLSNATKDTIKRVQACAIAGLVFAASAQAQAHEEERVTEACQTISGLGCEAMSGVRPHNKESAARVGHTLWRRAQVPGSNAVIDDRPLYWQRLSVKRAIKLETAPSPTVLDTFERASRGFYDLNFTANADLNVLITGFDPFGLHNNIAQSNPSGVAALTFDGLVIESAGVSAELQSALFPVRFEDFDRGMVESVVRPLLAGEAIDAIITISMGRDGFDLERFPGRNRSAQAPDNLMVTTGASRTNPLPPKLHNAPLEGPEFVEFTLPVAGMLTVQTPYPVRDNRNVSTLMRGQFTASSLAELAGETSVSGSGGGYLSNEISYRTLRLVRGATSAGGVAPIAAGHIHTPRISGADTEAVGRITRQIRNLLEAALPELLQTARARRTR